jgi:hypothetical protein
MGTKLAAVAVLVTAAATLTSVGAAGDLTSAAKQRVQIRSNTNQSTFVLAGNAGSLRHDSGTAIWSVNASRTVMRDGQSIEINDVTATFDGAHGTLTTRFRIEWTEAGHGYSIGSGTWKVVRGTGDYEHVTGGGRSASAWPPNGAVSWRAEGLVGPR